MYFGHYTAHAIPYFLSSNILPLNMLYFKSVAILMHEHHRMFHIYSTLLIKYTLTKLDPRQEGDYEIKFSRLNKQEKSFPRLGAKMWNCIQLYLRVLEISQNETLKRKYMAALMLQILSRTNDYPDLPTLLGQMQCIQNRP